MLNFFCRPSYRNLKGQPNGDILTKSSSVSMSQGCALMDGDHPTFDDDNICSSSNMSSRKRQRNGAFEEYTPPVKKPVSMMTYYMFCFCESVLSIFSFIFVFSLCFLTTNII